MSEFSNLWDCEVEISGLPESDSMDFDHEIPDWIDQDIAPNTIAAICQGGCASGAYMPAVTYHKATEIMNEHGDDVLEFIEQQYGEIPAAPTGTSWSAIAVFYLSSAVELWASMIKEDLSNYIDTLIEEGLLTE